MNESATALPDPFTSSLAGRRLGRYEVLARLASGGMAGVYVARALGVAGFERLFAIKVLHPHLAHEEEFITMFLDEARLAARIRHPNVVPTIDISDTQDAGYFLVMDYIQGDHLGALLQKAFKMGARLPAPASLRIVVDALDGLAAAHNLTDETGRPINLVHRDISPHNIMVSTDGISCITDFGVAKAEVRLSTTREGQFKGKLAYMAPEHASNGEADRRSDLFSMGIILWECLTGRRLFRAENHAATLNKICLEPIPMPSEVDPELAPFDHVLQKALAREPSERFQTAEEFADAIEQSADALGGLANQRAVAKLVKEYAAEKLARDETLIRTAIAEIGSPEPVVSEPVPSGAASARPGPEQPVVDAASPYATGEEMVIEEGKRNTPALVLAALVVIAALLGVVALMLSSDEPDDITASPLEPEPSQAAEPEPSAAEQADSPVQAEGQAEGQASQDGEEQAAGEAAEELRDEVRAEAQGEDDTEGETAAGGTEPSTREASPDSARRAAPRVRSGSRPAQRSRPARAASRSAERESPERAEESAGETPPRRKPRKKQSVYDDVLLNPYRQKN